MKTAELFEGMMKRSDPWISGERSGPRPEKVEPKTAKPTAHQAQLAALAKKANKTVDEVDKLWNDELKQVDPKLQNRYGIAMARVQRKLGLRK